jgi:hypothetical protein
MRHLPMPEDAGDDVIERQCARPGWAARRVAWLAAAAAYRHERGNPWKVAPAGFGPRAQAELRRLYDTRGRGGVIARIRRPAGGYSCCPMCGSLGGRSLDHALPRADFPEFSILRENLVPACTMCNSDEKGSTYRGRRPERFIHPYYDRWASQALWRIEFAPDLDVLQFQAIPLDSVPRRYRRVVQFHVSKVLGKEWRDAVRRDWGSLPQSLRLRLGAAADEVAIRHELELRLVNAMLTYGVNCWDAGFLRGTLADAHVVPKLVERVQALPA